MAMKRICHYDGKCCMRTEKGECVVLTDTYFNDGKCHFRKVRRNGPNQYDAKRIQEGRK